MKIIDVIQGDFEIVMTDEKMLNEYRRFGPESWEHKLGEVWEPYRFTEDLEAAYTEWIKTEK